MKKNLLDNHFKEKLSNYSSSVPDDMWDRIAPKTSKKPKGIWWNNKLLLLTVLLVTIGLFISISKLSKNNVTTDNVNTIINQKNNINISSEIDKTTAAIISENSSSKNQFKENKNNTTNNHSNIIHSKKAITSPLNVYTKKNEAITKKTSHNKNTTSKEKTSTKNVSINDMYNSNFINTNNNSSVVLNEDEHTTNYAFEKANPLLYSSFKSISLVDKKLLKTSYHFKEDCPSVNKNKRTDFYFEPYFAPEYTFKNIVGRDTVNAAYLKLKDSAEKMIGGFTAGFKFSKTIGSHLLLKAGAQYTQLNERLNIRIENDRKTITVITIKTVTDAFGNITTVSDTSSYIQLGYKTINTYNHYKNIEIPVSLSYEIDKEKYKLAINAGVLLNVASWYKGTVITPTYQLVNVSSKENKEIYQQKIGISLIAGISYIKPLSNRLDFFAEPYFKWNLSKNQPYNAYGFKQRFSAVGIALGLRYNLNYYKQH